MKTVILYRQLKLILPKVVYSEVFSPEDNCAIIAIQRKLVITFTPCEKFNIERSIIARF